MHFLGVKMTKEDRNKLLDKYFPKKAITWGDEEALKALAKVRAWSDVRAVGGLRSWMQRNGSEHRYKSLWLDMNPRNGVKISKAIEPSLSKMILRDVRERRKSWRKKEVVPKSAPVDKQLEAMRRALESFRKERLQRKVAKKLAKQNKKTA